MFEYRQVLLRLRAGDTDRDIARTKLMGRITKAGDPYLRMLLILGARSVLQGAKDRTDAVSRWAAPLQARVGYWKAIVAIAAKNARMC